MLVDIKVRTMLVDIKVRTMLVDIKVRTIARGLFQTIIPIIIT